MSERNGDWFLTFTGRQFWPCDPRPEDIEIEDIAHALSNICRFGGHCLGFYSVAQHSLHVSKLVPAQFALTALMHDATEAYCGDMVRPLKRQMPAFKAVEDKLWTAIAIRFDLPPQLDPVIKHWDDVALMTERRDLVIDTPHKWSISAPPSDEPVCPWPPTFAEARFLKEFRRLYVA